MPPLINQSSIFYLSALLASSLLAIGLAGCEKDPFQSDKPIPAGLREIAPTTLRGKLARTWGGDNFEVGQKEQLHYFFLTGVSCPGPGQPFFNEARDYLIITCSDFEIEMEVLRYDEHQSCHRSAIERTRLVQRQRI